LKASIPPVHISTTHGQHYNKLY